MTSPPVTRDAQLVGLRRRWTLAFVVGELVGFIPPAATGATLGTAGVPDAVLVIALTVAGMMEGMAIGVAEARVLARYAPAIDRPAWVRATVVAAAFAWFVGMAGGALMGTDVAPPLVLLILLVPAWAAALLSTGYGQRLVLRSVVPRSTSWVWVTAGAWLVGVMIPVIALSAAPDGWPGAAHAAVGVLAAIAMGVTVGGITGRTLERLLDQGGHAGEFARFPDDA